MSYTKTFFNKELENLVYQDIVDFFVDEKEESDTIEFKSFSTTYGNFNENLKGVIRAACAFLNSEGGIVIWGTPVGMPDPKRNNLKIFKGALSPVNELKEKDWIINKVSDSITPLPVGINLKILQNGTDYLYVFEIKQSTYRPHQYKDTYFARLDGQTKPAPHYLIEALFRQIKFPKLEGYIKLENISNNGTFYILDISMMIFNFSELQNEENVTFRLLCGQGTFRNSGSAQINPFYNMDGHQLVYNDFMKVLSFGAPGIHYETLIINPTQLATNHQNKVDLVLSFGGKKAPVKISEYILNMREIKWDQKDDLNYLFEKLDENIMMSERQEKMGKTREENLKNILGR